MSQVLIPTAIGVDRLRAGGSVMEMAKDCGADEREIEEALCFEQRRAA